MSRITHLVATISARSTQRWDRFKKVNICQKALYSKSEKSKPIDVNFCDGFFKFKIDDNHYVVSFWTPLRELTSNLVTEDSKKISFVDTKSGNALPLNQPFGDIVCGNTNVVFNLPKLGFFHFDCKDVVNEVVSWKLSKSHVWNEDIKSLEQQKESLLSTYKAMDTTFQTIMNDARSHSKVRFKWGGLFLLSAQLGFVGRLTWFEYSWDIMEPITWCLTYSMMIATFAYYNLTSQEYLLPDVEKRMLKNRFIKIAEKKQFDLEKFKDLQNNIKTLEQKILDVKSQNVVN